MIDDASSELTARFTLADSTEENMRLLDDYIARHGRPRAVYTDKASLFQVNRPLHHNKHLPGDLGPTQIGRALSELEIERITAHSVQAKGRVERSFQTMQDRLVKGRRRRAGPRRSGISTRSSSRSGTVAGRRCRRVQPMRTDR